MPEIRPARLPEDATLVAGSFGQYAQGLGIGLSFRYFDGSWPASPAITLVPKAACR